MLNNIYLGNLTKLASSFLSGVGNFFFKKKQISTKKKNNEKKMEKQSLLKNEDKDENKDDKNDESNSSQKVPSEKKDGEISKKTPTGLEKKAQEYISNIINKVDVLDRPEQWEKRLKNLIAEGGGNSLYAVPPTNTYDESNLSKLSYLFFTIAAAEKQLNKLKELYSGDNSTDKFVSTEIEGAQKLLQEKVTTLLNKNSSIQKIINNGTTELATWITTKENTKNKNKTVNNNTLLKELDKYAAEIKYELRNGKEPKSQFCEKLLSTLSEKITINSKTSKKTAEYPHFKRSVLLRQKHNLTKKIETSNSWLKFGLTILSFIVPSKFSTQYYDNALKKIDAQQHSSSGTKNKNFGQFENRDKDIASDIATKFQVTQHTSDPIIFDVTEGVSAKLSFVQKKGNPLSTWIKKVPSSTIEDNLKLKGIPLKDAATLEVIAGACAYFLNSAASAKSRLDQGNAMYSQIIPGFKSISDKAKINGSDPTQAKELGRVFALNSKFILENIDFHTGNYGTKYSADKNQNQIASIDYGKSWSVIIEGKDSKSAQIYGTQSPISSTDLDELNFHYQTQEHGIINDDQNENEELSDAGLTKNVPEKEFREGVYYELTKAVVTLPQNIGNIARQHTDDYSLTEKIKSHVCKKMQQLKNAMLYSKKYRSYLLENFLTIKTQIANEIIAYNKPLEKTHKKYPWTWQGVDGQIVNASLVDLSTAVLFQTVLDKLDKTEKKLQLSNKEKEELWRNCSSLCKKFNTTTSPVNATYTLADVATNLANAFVNSEEKTSEEKVKEDNNENKKEFNVDDYLKKANEKKNINEKNIEEKSKIQSEDDKTQTTTKIVDFSPRRYVSLKDIKSVLTTEVENNVEKIDQTATLKVLGAILINELINKKNPPNFDIAIFDPQSSPSEIFKKFGNNKMAPIVISFKCNTSTNEVGVPEEITQTLGKLGLLNLTKGRKIQPSLGEQAKSSFIEIEKLSLGEIESFKKNLKDSQETYIKDGTLKISHTDPVFTIPTVDDKNNKIEYEI